MSQRVVIKFMGTLVIIGCAAFNRGFMVKRIRILKVKIYFMGNSIM